MAEPNTSASARLRLRAFALRAGLLAVASLTACSASASRAEAADGARLSHLWVADGAADRSVKKARGIIRAVNEATLRTDLAAQISAIGVKEGGQFKRGARLVTFDCKRQRAQLAAAEAAHREMTLTFDSNRYLRRRKAIGRHEVAVAQARVDKAAAEAEMLRADVAKCIVAAPFNGAVAELMIKPHETPSAGQPMMRIVSNDDLEIELIVPSRWLIWVARGLPFTIRVDELDSAIAARVIRIGRVVDPVSQTVKLYGRADRAVRDLKAGMSGEAVFERRR